MWTAPDIPKAAQVVLGKYRLLVKLGQGGMGDVYLAASDGLGGVGRLVVVKRLRNIEDPQFVAMFIDEARIARKLSHPNIVQTYEIGREGGDHLIVMEYLDGPTLWRLRRAATGRGGVPWPMSLQIVSGVLEGLHYAHELRAADGRLLHIVHRDLSAENVIVTQLGECKILDFGIAKAADSIVQTQAGFVKGRLHNMPPEQLRGPKVDRRADIFAAGVMLWESLAGRSLWGNLGNVAISNRLMQGEIPSLRELGPAVPDELRLICEKAMAPEADDRFATALAMKAALTEYAERNGLVVNRSQLAEFVEPLFTDDREKIDHIIRAQLEQSGMRYSGVTRVPRSDLEPPAGGRTPAGGPVTLEGATPMGGSATQRTSPSKWAAIIVALGASVAAGIWFWQTRLVSRPGTFTPLPPPSVKVTGDEAAAKYVAAAEQLAAHRSYDAARGLLAKASSLDISDPELNIRIARLRDSMEMAALLSEANGHLENQRWRPAIDSAKKALERHPDNAQALAIVATARGAQQGTSQPPARGKPRGQGRERGEGRVKKPLPGMRLAARDQSAAETREEPPAAATESGQTAPTAEPAEVPRSNPPPTSSRDAAASAAAKSGPALGANPPTATRPRAAAASSKPKVAVPTLPRVYVVPDSDQLRNMCAKVEAMAASLGGVGAEYAHGFTRRLQSTVEPGETIYPSAIYYFIVREWNLKHDHATATNALVVGQKNGEILRFKDYSTIEPGR
jgi:serine/threonine protein kinase